MSARGLSEQGEASISGAREGRNSGLRRLFARAAARRLSVLVVPGPDVARAAGLDFEAEGLSLAASPREANVLAIVGELPAGLARAATVAYAQMPRPRATLLVGVRKIEPLPADVRAEANPGSLAVAVEELRRAFSRGAFTSEAEDFDAAALQTRTIYTCPMHPEVQSEEPGQCPKCGMDLVPTESSGAEGEEQHNHGDHDHGTDGHDGGHDGGHEHGAHEHEARETGEDQEHGGHSHHEHSHRGHVGGNEDEGEGGGEVQEIPDPAAGEDFMSMVEMTQGAPRSSDGLQMEWVEAPFGPLFPGLPGGLALKFTLDGDTVARAEAGSAAGDREDLLRGAVSDLPRRLAGLDPLSPFSYSLLALLALEAVSGHEPGEEESLRRIRTAEVERAASHAGWLADFAHLLGLERLRRQASRLQLRALKEGHTGPGALVAEAERLRGRAMRAPFLARRLRGTARLSAAEIPAGGPVARACDVRADARAEFEGYRALGFEPVTAEGGDALSRLELRLREIEQSLSLAREAHSAAGDGLEASARQVPDGSGEATVETPRGPATLNVAVEGGEISSAELSVPSEALLGLAEAVAEQRELGEALAGVASLDLSPWGAQR